MLSPLPLGEKGQMCTKPLPPGILTLGLFSALYEKILDPLSFGSYVGLYKGSYASSIRGISESIVQNSTAPLLLPGRKVGSFLHYRPAWSSWYWPGQIYWCWIRDCPETDNQTGNFWQKAFQWGGKELILWLSLESCIPNRSCLALSALHFFFLWVWRIQIMHT